MSTHTAKQLHINIQPLPTSGLNCYLYKSELDKLQTNQIFFFLILPILLQDGKGIEERVGVQDEQLFTVLQDIRVMVQYVCCELTL